MIAIGIDTGGTCTDAVIYDAASHQVLSYGKTLTTKKDLKVGILGALRCLDQELLKKAEHISLSTTLATNACVEGKGGRAKLVFIGVKPAFVEKCREPMDCRPSLKFIFCQVTHQKQLARKRNPIGNDFGQTSEKCFVNLTVLLWCR